MLQRQHPLLLLLHKGTDALKPVCSGGRHTATPALGNLHISLALERPTKAAEFAILTVSS